MFKVGDKVVYTDIQGSCVLTYEGEDNNPFKLHWLSYPDGTTGYIFSLDKIRKATPEEIAAGHRINKSPLLQHLDKCQEVVKTWPKWKLQSVRDAFCIPDLSENERQADLSIKQDNQDIGDDSQIENHISKNCKVVDYE